MDSGENPTAPVWLSGTERELLATAIELVKWPKESRKAALALHRKLGGREGASEDHGDTCRCESCRYHD